MQRLFTFCLLIALWPLPAHAEEFHAKVIGITDGDTLTVLKAKHQVKIRLNGIDAPESGQDFGSRAKQAASDRAFGKEVTVRVLDKDRYGRTVADTILPNGKSLNQEMVREGMAWWYRHYAPADQTLAKLEHEAKAAKRGLWSQANPIPPWDWRHGERTAVFGNRNSQIYHARGCPSVARMKETNKIIFKTAAEAEAMGYRKAEDCK
jgi:endonuclease YncB( thermonuclease family)